MKVTYMTKLEDMLSMNDLMQLFGVTRQAIHRWIKNRPDFPKPSKIVGKLLWNKLEIEAYIKASKKPN